MASVLSFWRAALSGSGLLLPRRPRRAPPPPSPGVERPPPPPRRERRPVSGGFSCSCQMISDQRLDGAVEADIWERGEASGRERHRIGRPETDEAHLALLGMPASQRLRRVGGEGAGEDGKSPIVVPAEPAG